MILYDKEKEGFGKDLGIKDQGNVKIKICRPL